MKIHRLRTVICIYMNCNYSNGIYLQALINIFSTLSVRAMEHMGSLERECECCLSWPMGVEDGGNDGQLGYHYLCIVRGSHVLADGYERTASGSVVVCNSSSSWYCCPSYPITLHLFRRLFHCVRAHSLFGWVEHQNVCIYSLLMYYDNLVFN